MKKLFILILILLIVGGGAYIFFREGTLPVNKNDTTTQKFTIEKGEALDPIINKLFAQGLIRNRISFLIVVKQLKLEKKIQAGDFRISPSLNAYQIADALTHGTLDTWITIREGLRKEEIAEILSKDLGIPEVEFNQIAREGYLFPDTYLVPQGASARTIVDILRNTFDSKYDSSLKAKAQKLGLTDKEVLILASMVEREAKAADRQEIASIIVKRYKEDWALNIDATIQYALGYQKIEKTWWKKTLTFDDLKLDSPYNTYKHNGLPPTPICNPGIESIRAVVNADLSTPYWFYLADPSGKTHYAKTSEEHEKNVDKYLK